MRFESARRALAGVALAASMAGSQSAAACLERVGELDFDHDPVLSTVTYQVEVAGNTAFLLTNGRLHVVDVTDPTAPAESAVLDLPSSSVGRVMRLVGERLWIAGGSSGALAVDVGNPAAPTLEAVVPASTSVQDMLVMNGLLVLSDFGLRVVDVSNLVAPVELSAVPFDGVTHALAALGDHVVIAAGSAITVIDLADPAHPEVVAERLVAADAMEVRRDLMYVAVANPQFPSTPPTGGQAVAASDGDGGLEIWDVADPAQLTRLGSYDLGALARGVAVVGDLAFVAASLPGTLSMLDVSDPSSIALTASLDVAGFDLVATGGLVYHASFDGLVVFAIDTCAQPLSSLWVPAVAHVDGVGGSRWRSDLTVRNGGSQLSEIRLTLSTEAGSSQLVVPVAAGAQAALVDVVGMMSADGTGLLEISGDQPLVATSRTYHAGADGTYGQLIRATPAGADLAAGDEAWLLHLRQLSGEFRTNLLFANTASDVARIGVDLSDSSGSPVATFTVVVEPRRVVHELQPFAFRAGRPDLGWGFARIYVELGSGVQVLASVIDARTQDAITIEAAAPP